METIRLDELEKVFVNRPVMAISLWQPWASLIMAGAKRFETRSWATEYRGPLVICAAKGGLGKSELYATLVDEIFQRALFPILGLSQGLSIKEFANAAMGILPRGKALGCVDLVDCIGTDLIGDHSDIPFGDFSHGRFAWRLEKVRRFDKPVPVKGKQGFFKIDLKAVGGLA